MVAARPQDRSNTLVMTLIGARLGRVQRRMKVIVQFPCLNEEHTLPLVLERMPRRLPGVDELTGSAREVLGPS